MKRFFNIAVLAFQLCLLYSCTEEYNLELNETDTKYLCVQTVLTDFPSVQTITLSESVHYKGKEVPPAVSGAYVAVSDGENDVEFVEDPEAPGCYRSPDMFCCKPGCTYELRVERMTDEGLSVYEASAQMPSFGFDIEAIDYKYMSSLQDSTWTVGIWGTDSPNEDYYLVNAVVNGNVYPWSVATPVPDMYFNGASVKGYPICVLNQTWENYKKRGPCYKPFETGDVLSLMVYGLDKRYYDFWYSFFESTSSMNIPIIASHPANLDCNISGKNVVGYFGVCPVRIVSVVIDDPYRTEFIYGKQ